MEVTDAILQMDLAPSQRGKVLILQAHYAILTVDLDRVEVALSAYRDLFAEGQRAPGYWRATSQLCSHRGDRQGAEVALQQAWPDPRRRSIWRRAMPSWLG